MFDLFLRRYVPGFRISPQDDIPGFNVRSQDDVPGFNVDENGTQGQDTIWSYGLPPGSVTPQDPDTAQTPPPPPGVDDPAPPALPALPELPYRLATMLPLRWPAAFDSQPRPRVEIAPPGVGSAAIPGADRWPASSTTRQPAGIRSPVVTTQNKNPQAAIQQTMPNALPWPLKGGWPYARGNGALPTVKLIQPLADSNFSLANVGDAGGQSAQQSTLLRQYQQTQRTMPSAPPGTVPAMVNLPEKPSMNMTELERSPEQEFSQVVEAYRRLKEVPGSQPIGDQSAPQPLIPEQNTSRADDPNPNDSAQGQTQAQNLRMAKIDQSPRDAGGLPNGGIVSSVGPPRSLRGNDEINAIYNRGGEYQSDQNGTRTTGGISPRDLNIHLIGDGDAPSNVSDLSRRERHELGVEASIATALERGFEITLRREVATDVPGFPTPRFYDYIMRDPITGKQYGVEVKTTLYDTIRLDPSQVMKDAVVVAQGAKVRNRGVWLDGVSYSTYCFGCEELDIRSWVLQRILRNAGVSIARGTLPGEIRP